MVTSIPNSIILQVYLALNLTHILDCALHFVSILALAVEFAHARTIAHVLVIARDLGLGPVLAHVLYESTSLVIAVVVRVLLFELVKLLAGTSWVELLDSGLMLLEALLFVAG